MLNIRRATGADQAEIFGVHRSAFGAAEGPEIVELVSGLSEDPTAVPLLSLVAESRGKVIAHILFTMVRLPFDDQPDDQSDDSAISAQILAPLGVAKAHQGKGVGGALIRYGLERLAASGTDLVFVLGHPGYYPKFGFRPAGELGYAAPYPIAPEHADAWMVHELSAGAIGYARGEIRCANVLNQPELWQA